MKKRMREVNDELMKPICILVALVDPIIDSIIISLVFELTMMNTCTLDRHK